MTTKKKEAEPKQQKSSQKSYDLVIESKRAMKSICIMFEDEKPKPVTEKKPAAEPEVKKPVSKMSALGDQFFHEQNDHPT